MRQHSRVLSGERGLGNRRNPILQHWPHRHHSKREGVLSAVVKSSGCGIGEMWVRSGLIQLCEVGQLIKFLPVKNRNFKSTELIQCL